MLTLKDHVTGMSKFSRYRAGNLYYITETGLEFPIPIDDTNEATFPAQEKSLFFMRWIRQRLKSDEAMNELVRLGQEIGA